MGVVVGLTDGLGQLIGAGSGLSAARVAVYWDVALDKTGVSYVLFYQKKPFDFEADPALEEAEKKILHPGITEEYERGEEDAFPYAAEIHGLESGQPYYMLIRAVDRSENHNMEQNTVYKTVIPE